MDDKGRAARWLVSLPPNGHVPELVYSMFLIVKISEFECAG